MCTTHGLWLHSVLFLLIRYARAAHASFATIVKRNKWSWVKMRRHTRNKHRGKRVTVAKLGMQGGLWKFLQLQWKGIGTVVQCTHSQLCGLWGVKIVSKTDFMALPSVKEDMQVFIQREFSMLSFFYWLLWKNMHGNSESLQLGEKWKEVCVCNKKIHCSGRNCSTVKVGHKGYALWLSGEKGQDQRIWLSRKNKDQYQSLRGSGEDEDEDQRPVSG